MSISVNLFRSEELNKAYELLENVTPLSTDCGKLCGGKCCKGSESDGMLLFPGEEELFSGLEGFRVYYDSRYNSNAVSCSGCCNRKIRPLSCRIFPFFPYVISDGKYSNIYIAPDMRALDFCDILTSDLPVDKKYMRALRIASRVLAGNEEIRKFMIKITELLTDFGKFN